MLGLGSELAEWHSGVVGPWLADWVPDWAQDWPWGLALAVVAARISSTRVEQCGYQWTQLG